MAFTKIVGAGIHTLSNVHTHNINSSGIITATNFVGPFDGTTGDFSGNVTIGGNLVVNGDTTTLNTTLREVELLRVDATDNTVTAGIITQRGSGDILNLFDNNTEVLTVKDGGKVGIGTVNPSQMLSVYGNIYQRGNDYITWNNGDSQIGGVSGYNFAISTYDGSSEMLERVRITGGSNGGRVGIGSVIPANKLDVALGAAWIYPDEDGTEAVALRLGKLSDYNTSFNDILVVDNDGSSSPTYRVTSKINRYIGNWAFDRNDPTGRINGFQLRSHASGGNIGNAFIIRDLKNTADSFKFWTNGNSFVGVTTDGTARNFGIGTNNPTKALHVSASQPEILLEHTGGYDMTLTTNDGSGQNGITVNGGFLSLAYNNKNIVMCRTGGSVGIGTNNPTGLLDINTTSGVYDHLRLRRTGSGAGDSDWSLKPYGGHLYFRTGAANDKITFTSEGGISVAAGGKVGFATDSNTYFEQDGLDRLSFTVGGVKTVSMIENGSTYPVLLVDANGTNTSISQQGAGYNANANANDLVIGNVSSGNHGLTICSPSSGYGAINFSDGSGGGLDASRGSLSYEHTPEELILRAKIGKIVLRNDSTDTLVTTNNGRVGIGSEIPNSKLEVWNNTNIEVLRLKDTHFNKYLTIRGGGTPNRMVIDSYEGNGGGAAIDLATNGTTRLRIDSSGNTQLGSSADAGNALRYFDVYNLNTGGSAGSIIRLITTKSDGSSSTSADIVKYKTGGLYINNNQVDGTTGFISFGTGTGGGSIKQRLRITNTGRLKINHNSTVGQLDDTWLSIYDANSDSSANDPAGISKNYAMINLHNYGTGNVADVSGIGFGAGAAFTYTKGSIAFQRQGSYGTGDLVFLTNNDQDSTMVNNTDEKMRITRDSQIIFSDCDVSIGRDTALANYADGSTTRTQLAVVKDGGGAGSGYHEVAHFTGGTDTNDTGAIVRITQFNNDRGLYIKAGRGSSDQAKALIGLRDSAANDTNFITITQNADQITAHRSVDINNGYNLSIGGSSGTHAPLHVKSENTSYGKNAVFGASGWVNHANYHYTDATITLLGRDLDGNDKGTGIEMTARNTANTNWMHGALTMDQSGHIRIFTGGAGTTQGTEKLQIDNVGNLKQGTSTPNAFTGSAPSHTQRFLGKKCMQGSVTSVTTLSGSGTGTFDLGRLWITDDTSIELFIQVVRNDATNFVTHYAKAFVQKVRGAGMSNGHILYQNGAAQSNGFTISGIQSGGYTASGGSTHGTQITVSGGAGGVIYRMTCFYTAISKNDMY